MTKRTFLQTLALGAALPSKIVSAAGAEPNRPGKLDFIDTSFENASPVWWEVSPDGTISLYLLYDLERSSPNRAAGHFHFKICAAAGTELTFEFKNLDNVWNGQPGSVARELKSAVISENGREWRPIALQGFGENQVRMRVNMPGPELFVARIEPYRLSDLEHLLSTLHQNPAVQVSRIGQTVEGRDLEIIRIGNEDAPYHVFLRARAHPWESGSNWVVHGLIDRLVAAHDESREFLKRYCVWIMPMANKDGVARGRTRFNSLGKDLNREWDKPADSKLVPENYALEQWLLAMIERGLKPHLALELHNDGGGLLHISRPPVAGLDRHLARMERLERLLREHTWFTEGSTRNSFRNSSTLGDGWLERFGIDAAVHEFNCNWIAGLKDFPSARHWKAYGAGLAKVFYEYFAER